MQAPAPTELRYRKDSRELTIAWEAEQYVLGAEFLRVHSPSAEVQGHAGEGGTLPVGKQAVAITGIEPVGNYAVRIRFSDGHDTGLYSWDWLLELCRDRDRLWQAYRDKVGALQPTTGSAPGNGVGTYTPGK
jgi:DUF971 family protein